MKVKVKVKKTRKKQKKKNISCSLETKFILALVCVCVCVQNSWHDHTTLSNTTAGNIARANHQPLHRYRYMAMAHELLLILILIAHRSWYFRSAVVAKFVKFMLGCVNSKTASGEHAGDAR